MCIQKTAWGWIKSWDLLLHEACFQQILQQIFLWLLSSDVFRTAVSFPASSHSVTAHQEASVSSAVCYSSYCSTELSFSAGNDLRLLFSRPGSISSLFKTPMGEETSVFAAISREHIGDSAGLTVADKSCMINTHTHSHTHTHMQRGAGGGSLLLGEQQTSGWALIINHQTRFYKAFSRKAWQHGRAFESTSARHN